MSDELAAIVTAAGASERMGRHKALLPWRSRPLVAHQVELLETADFDQIAVVTGADAELVAPAIPDAARRIHHPEWRRGRSSSIEAGADALSDRPTAILVVAVDQPLVRRVLDEIVRHAGAPLVQPADTDGRLGHPVMFGGDRLEALRSLRDEPEGLRSLARRLRSEGRVVPIDDLPHWDLNTPEAYRRARRRANDTSG